MRAPLAMWLLAGCAAGQPWGSAVETTATRQTRSIPIGVTNAGFVPDRVEVEHGESVTLVFTRTVEHTCAKQVIVELDAHREVHRDLPLHEPVAVALQFEHAGELGFTCGMKMLGGTIVVH